MAATQVMGKPTGSDAVPASPGGDSDVPESDCEQQPLVFGSHGGSRERQEERQPRQTLGAELLEEHVLVCSGSERVFVSIVVSFLAMLTACLGILYNMGSAWAVMDSRMTASPTLGSNRNSPVVQLLPPMLGTAEGTGNAAAPIVMSSSSRVSTTLVLPVLTTSTLMATTTIVTTTAPQVTTTIARPALTTSTGMVNPGTFAHLYKAAYVIHRSVDVERWEQFQEHARIAGVNASIFEATDKTTMDVDKLVKDNEISESMANHLKKSPSQRGPFACTISHNLLWRELVREAARPDDQFLIFEDDSIIPLRFHIRLEKAMRVVPGDWDLLYLNHNRLVGEKLPGNVWLKPNASHHQVGTNALLNAYLVRASGLERILRFQRPINYTYTNDDNLRRHFKDFNAYFLIDILVLQRGRSVRTKPKSPPRKR